MAEQIAQAAKEKDSVGAVIEVGAIGLPVGVGEPIFDSVESRLASIYFSIPGVKGVEFGTGFAAAAMRGSAHNDPFTMEDGQIRTVTNHAGGILGGITNGMPLLARVAMKPTPSIALEQQTVDLNSGQPTPLEIVGRHDPCIGVRAVPCVEAATAIQLLDLIYINQER